ncbi:MAG: cytochrome c oxidase assembly protein [Pseudomonadota bacterium]
MRQDIKKTVQKLTLFSVAMFGFGYALVPLYDVFCEVVGINGKTGVVAEKDLGKIDESRLVTVEFDTTTNIEIPWDFKAVMYKTKVHPGQLTEVNFIAENYSNRTIIGKAVPSVAPTKASLYFNKTECFCFTEQKLLPGEKKIMPVRFVVDANLPEKIKMMTLSYTFFEVPESERVVSDVAKKEITNNKS